VIRPGPDAIAPGLAPGGLVFHAYDLAGGYLNSHAVTTAPSGDADVMSVDPDAGPVVLVVYDGDTGIRFSPTQLAAAGLTSGQRL
jgi:hypothetical protein